jgi:hypothetical protein
LAAELKMSIWRTSGEYLGRCQRSGLCAAVVSILLEILSLYIATIPTSILLGLILSGLQNVLAVTRSLRQID